MKNLIEKLVVMMLIMTGSFVGFLPKSEAQGLALHFISARSSPYELTEEDIEKGFCQVTVVTFKIVADSNWIIKADIRLLSSPKKKDILNPSFVKVKSSDFNEWIPGGGIIQTGKPTEGQFLAIDLKLDLVVLGDAPLGEYVFAIVVNLERLTI